MLYKCVASTSERKKTAAAEKIRRVARFCDGWQIKLFFCCIRPLILLCDGTYDEFVL